VVPQPPEDRLWLFGVANRVIADHRRSTIRRLRLGVSCVTVPKWPTTRPLISHYGN
jgi:hypothetical protein